MEFHHRVISTGTAFSYELLHASNDALIFCSRVKEFGEQTKNYKLTAATVSPEQEGKYLIKTHGNLRIAGVTKEVTMDVYCVVNKDATIRCSGSDKLKMTDYQVKPPSFMLGAMTTGDDILLDFTLVYKK